MLSPRPPPMTFPSRDMTSSPLLAGCDCLQHGPGCKPGVRELCWEARTSPGSVPISKALAGAGSCPACEADGVVGCRQGVKGTRWGSHRGFFSFLRKRHVQRQKPWR